MRLTLDVLILSLVKDVCDSETGIRRFLKELYFSIPYSVVLRIHLEKKGIRALGIAESFRVGQSNRSVLAGVVMRSDLVIDGFVFGSSTLEGNDATDAVVKMYKTLKRNDINVVILGGAVLSLYNIINLDEVGSETNLPVICVTFEESEGLEETIKNHFPDRWRSKLKTYSKLGERNRVNLKTGYHVFIRNHGIYSEIATKVLDKFTVQGAIPEPIRVARLMARARIISS